MHIDGPRPKGDESHSAGPGSDNVHISGPGAPPMVDLGGYKGVRQASLPPAAAPLSTHRRGRPPAASTSAPAQPQQQPSQRPQHGASHRKAAQPASAPAKPVKRQRRRRP